jgi:hypothetical protein
VLRNWGEALSSRGRGGEGRAKLGAALELFKEMTLEREADEVAAQLTTG